MKRKELIKCLNAPDLEPDAGKVKKDPKVFFCTGVGTYDVLSVYYMPNGSICVDIGLKE